MQGYCLIRGISMFTNLKLLNRVKLCNKYIYLRKSTTDFFVFSQVFLYKEYHIDLSNFSPNIIIDAGAHVGFTTLFYKEKYPNTKIICVEPESSNFTALKKMLLI